MSDKGDFRTAPTTPGLLNILQGDESKVSVEVENLVTELMENLNQFVLDPAPQVVAMERDMEVGWEMFLTLVR